VLGTDTGIEPGHTFGSGEHVEMARIKVRTKHRCCIDGRAAFSVDQGAQRLEVGNSEAIHAG
jgi:hypothetical protein